MNRRSTITMAITAVAAVGIGGGAYLVTTRGRTDPVRTGTVQGTGQGTSAGNARQANGDTGPARAAPATGRETPVGTDDGSDFATAIRNGDLQTELTAMPLAGTLSATDREGLVWMREEEKLAHDVYLALAKRWQNGPFSNIATAEATHTDAVRQLLDRYGIADPSIGMAAGAFANPAFARLHQDLVAAGSSSYVEALKVGAQIEELDIRDLKDRASALPDISRVYADLERGSRNHLRAFARQIQRQGAKYDPTHISKAEYDAIVSGGNETGQGR